MGLRDKEATLGEAEVTPTPRISLKIQNFCPVCKQFVKDRRFKSHILNHWIKGGGVGAKSNEEYADFVRRIFKSKVKIQFELLDE